MSTAGERQTDAVEKSMRKRIGEEERTPMR